MAGEKIIIDPDVMRYRSRANSIPCISMLVKCSDPSVFQAGDYDFPPLERSLTAYTNLKETCSQ